MVHARRARKDAVIVPMTVGRRLGASMEPAVRPRLTPGVQTKAAWRASARRNQSVALVRARCGIKDALTSRSLPPAPGAVAALIAKATTPNVVTTSVTPTRPSITVRTTAVRLRAETGSARRTSPVIAAHPTVVVAQVPSVVMRSVKTTRPAIAAQKTAGFRRQRSPAHRWMSSAVITSAAALPLAGTRPARPALRIAVSVHRSAVTGSVH